MNKVILMGRLTRDPSIKEGEMAVARYTLAVDRRGKKEDGKPTADFISCVAFGKSADFVQNYLHQGMKVAVCGHIQTGSYTNKDGQKVYTTDVIVDEHEFCEKREAGILKPEKPDNGFVDVTEAPGFDALPFN